MILEQCSWFSLHCIYFDSQYIFRPNVNNLVETLENSLINLNMARMIHLSMDRPNTNWAFFEKIQQNYQMKKSASLVNLQSCSLCAVSGALQTGITNTNLNLEKIF